MIRTGYRDELAGDRKGKCGGAGTMRNWCNNNTAPETDGMQIVLNNCACMPVDKCQPACSGRIRRRRGRRTMCVEAGFPLKSFYSL